MSIAAIVSYAGLLSPLSSNVYFPSLTEIEKDFRISTSLVNLSVTVFMIFQALTPSFWGSLADIWGRRPVYICTEIIFLCVCAGLANSQNFSVLVVLRMFQAMGASSAIALGSGVLGDITEPAERGAYFSAFTCCQLLSTALGPVIGGAIAQNLSWRWIFYILMIVGGIALFIIVFFLPETLRTLVGNGSGYANPTPQQWFRYHVRGKPIGPKANRRRFLRLPRVWEPFTYLLYPDVALIMLSNGLVAAMLAVYLTTTSTHFERIYGLDTLQIGLCYLPFGLGCFLGSLLASRILNRDFEAVASKCGVRPEKGVITPAFPIFLARLRTVWIQLTALQVVTIVYGWVLYKHVHLAVPLILQFIAGFSVTCSVSAFQTLSVDLFPGKAASIGASSNLVRSSLGAAATACIEPGINGIGVGWMFTLMGIILITSTAVIPVIMKSGPGWWQRRWERQQQK
ncbi:major facilitator superfamily domain-containing protein [Dichotomocladium elegans]|nr:major facilitator superfamily domain-containing protein [Dichotomocladium elegans]